MISEANIKGVDTNHIDPQVTAAYWKYVLVHLMVSSRDNDSVCDITDMFSITAQ